MDALSGVSEPGVVRVARAQAGSGEARGCPRDADGMTADVDRARGLVHCACCGAETRGVIDAISDRDYEYTVRTPDGWYRFEITRGGASKSAFRMCGACGARFARYLPVSSMVAP